MLELSSEELCMWHMSKCLVYMMQGWLHDMSNGVGGVLLMVVVKKKESECKI